MNISEQIKKHEHGIKLINAIQELKNRIANHEIFSFEIDNNYDWYQERIAVDTAIKNRLQKYYDSNFKL